MSDPGSLHRPKKKERKSMKIPMFVETTAAILLPLLIVGLIMPWAIRYIMWVLG
jgi:hypothetical protein